jgi:hypothetical protein
MREGGRWPSQIGCTLVGFQWKILFLDPTCDVPLYWFRFCFGSEVCLSRCLVLQIHFSFLCSYLLQPGFSVPYFPPGCPLDSSPTSRPLLSVSEFCFSGGLCDIPPPSRDGQFKQDPYEVPTPKHWRIIHTYMTLIQSYYMNSWVTKEIHR